MKAMIFAAGKGTRLKPLTNCIPKALVKVNGKALLAHVITNLKVFGVKEIIINVHYLADQISEFLEAHNYFDMSITLSDETEELLDTGGGLMKTSGFFSDNEDFIVHNVDVLSNLNLSAMLACHKKNNSLATIAVRQRNTSRYFLFDQNNVLRGWQNIQTGEARLTDNKYQQEALKPLAFSGIHIINSKIFEYLSDTGVFSITQSYLDLAAKSHTIKGYECNNSFWFDVGKIETLKEAEDFLRHNKG